MARILFLAHRIPFPPNKGDKIRSWHFLKHLSEYHDVHVGFFVDDKQDLEHIGYLQTLCESVDYSFATPLKQKLSSLSGLLNGGSLTENAYPSRKFRRKIKALLDEHKVDLIFLYSAASFTFLPLGKINAPVLTDFVDVDSAKWRAYSDTASFPMSWIYRREAGTLAKFEALVAQASAMSIAVSDDEAAFMRDNLHDQGISVPVVGIENGVNVNVFSPEKYADTSKAKRVIFTGAMDYAPNIEAVVWFVKEVLGRLRAHDSDIEFYIAGRPVSPVVERLATIAGVTVLGGVQDMAAEIAQAEIVVAPLKTARGIQNKVLEGMAMAKPVVCTAAANEGIGAPAGRAVALAETSDEFVAIIENLFRSQQSRLTMGLEARDFVSQNFSWRSTFQKLDDCIAGILDTGTQTDSS